VTVSASPRAVGTIEDIVDAGDPAPRPERGDASPLQRFKRAYDGRPDH
jgi:hypothetical protein